MYLKLIQNNFSKETETRDFRKDQKELLKLIRRYNKVIFYNQRDFISANIADLLKDIVLSKNIRAKEFIKLIKLIGNQISNKKALEFLIKSARNSINEPRALHLFQEIFVRFSIKETFKIINFTALFDDPSIGKPLLENLPEKRYIPDIIVLLLIIEPKRAKLIISNLEKSLPEDRFELLIKSLKICGLISLSEGYE